MVLPGTIPKFSLNITPQKLNGLTQEIITILQKSVNDIIERSENKKIDKLDLLKEWHKTEGIAAEKQTFCTLPSLVSILFFFIFYFILFFILFYFLFYFIFFYFLFFILFNFFYFSYKNICF